MDGPAFPPQFHPIVTAWFQRRFGEPSPPQRQGWPLIAARKHTLILAPTGSGKTLAAFLACLDALIHELLGVGCSVLGVRSSDGSSPVPNTQHRTPNTGPGVRILYVSPLKALNYDIEKNLREPLAGLAEEARQQGLELPEIRVGVRTGDTRSKERQQMVRRPPHILITTPESLHLILTSQARAMLETVQFLILDEIHALCNNKRGVFTSLLLERLEEVVASGVGCSVLGVREGGPEHRTPNTEHPTPNTFVRIGLSATQRPLEEVARYLGGAAWEGDRLVPRPVEIVDAGMRKRLSLQVLCPVDDLAHMQAQTLWPGIVRRLLGLISERKSTIVFANNRRQVERLTAHLNEAAREEIALPHHGSIAAPVRKITEERLKRGDVRAVCATGTLELGIDMGAVELVCQVESPRQVSKGLQRVGRAGHLMSAVSEGRILAKQPLDLLEAAVLAREMLAGRVETLQVPHNCLDVLAQQIVAIVADGERSLDELYRLVRRSYCYHDLPEAQFHGTVAMISGRYPSHLFRDLRARVALDRVRQRLLPLPGTRRAALTNGGTIPDTGQFGVYISDRRVKLGELDEEFIYESRVGDIFSLGIDSWRIDRIEADRVLVSPAPGAPARMPFWRGESYGREPELGRALGEFITEVGARLDEPDVESWIASEVPVDEVGAWNIAAYLRHGREKCGSLPTHRTLLVESFEDEVGERRLAILSPLGRRVHLTLRLALAALIKERFGVDPEALHNDDGLLLRLPGGEAELPLDLLHQVPPEAVWERVVQQLGSSPLFGLRFRQNAARALLLPGARPGKRSPLWLQRLKAKDLLAVAAGYDDFPIVLETYRECLEEFLAVDTARELLEGLRAGTVTAVENRRTAPSPFVATLLFDFQAIYQYEWDRPKGIGQNATEAQQRLVADLVGYLRAAPELLDPRTLAEREARLQGTAPDARARTPAEFLELLRRLGDLPADADAIAARCVGDAPALLHTLCADRLLVQIPLPGAERPWHWILTEEWPLYREAFLSGVRAFRRSGVQDGAGPSSSPGLPHPMPTFLVRVAGDREVALEEAVPAAFRDQGTESAAEEQTPGEQARQSILRRFALHRMLTSAGEVASWYGLSSEEAEAILRELEVLGVLVSVMPPGERDEIVPSGVSQPHQVIRSGTRAAGDGRQVITRWASPEHLENAYVATLARRRREARPASIAQYQRFLLAWQRRIGPPLIGEEGVREVLGQLQGLPLPATIWEGEVLARRVRPYQPGWLDRACETGEFVWQGSSGSFSGRGRVAFFLREVFPFWPGGAELPLSVANRSADLLVGEAAERKLGAAGEAAERKLGATGKAAERKLGATGKAAERKLGATNGFAEPELGAAITTRVAEMLAQRGASFLIDVALATGLDSREVAVALWELIWRGQVTHDQWGVIRAGPPAGRPAAPSARPAVPGRWPGQRQASSRWPRPQLSGRGLSSRGSASGRYSWLPALREDRGARSAKDGPETADLVARQMLERYGIVARELLELESVPLPWGAIYEALNRMELTGEIKRGYFIEGFTGAQFGLPRACDELKAIQERRTLTAPEFVLLNACDPANLSGAAVRGQGRDEGETGTGAERRQRGDGETGRDEEEAGGENHAAASSTRGPVILRLPSNYVVLRDGMPALLLEAGARRLTPLMALADGELAGACGALRDLTEHPWPLRPIRQLRIERWGDRPIRGSEAEAPLRALGFSASPKGLEL